MREIGTASCVATVRYAPLVSELPVGVEVAEIPVRVSVVDVPKESAPYKRAAFRCQVVKDDSEHEFRALTRKPERVSLELSLRLIPPTAVLSQPQA